MNPRPGARRLFTRRDASRLMAAAAIASVLPGCQQPAGAGERVVLYSSVDSWLLGELVDACRAETGLDVVAVGDTEATKTTGLVTRLIAERDRPRADVWWSSEPFGTIRLAEEGVLAPMPVGFDPVPEAWPDNLIDPQRRWVGHALRSRVIAYSTDRVGESAAPRTLREAVDPAWAGRVGIARPHFGTTRGHLGALHAAWGGEGLTAWVNAARERDIRVYDGNATVVRKIAEGEIDAGLTDTDDVHAAVAQGLPVGMVFEAIDDTQPFPSAGPMRIPCTAGLVAGGPNPDAGKRLLAWLLGGEAERRLASSDSRNAPVHPAVVPEFPDLAAPPSRTPPLGEVAASIEPALAIWDASGIG